MLTKAEKIINAFLSLDIGEARSAWIRKALLERRGVPGLVIAMVDGGFEVVDVREGSPITPDGREVIWVAGAAWALTLANHTTQLEAAFAQIKNQEEAAKSVLGTESMSIMICPKCGDTLQHTEVCSKCAAGKLGYRHRYTCVCGGVDMVSKEAI